MAVGASSNGQDEFPTYPGCEFRWTEDHLSSGTVADYGEYETSASFKDVRDFYLKSLGARFNTGQIHKSRSALFISFQDTYGGFGNGSLFVLAPRTRRPTTQVIVYLMLQRGELVMLVKERSPGLRGVIEDAVDLVSLPFQILRYAGPELRTVLRFEASRALRRLLRR
jgi:hypothetical protein